MINKILIGFIKLVIHLVEFVFTPIDTLIQNVAPDLSNALNQIGGFFNYVNQFIGWAVSITGLSSETLSLIVIFYTFKLTAPLMVYVIKLALRWYRKLMP